MSFTIRVLATGINAHQPWTNRILFLLFVLLQMPTTLKAQDLKTHITENKVATAINELEKRP